MNDNDMSEMIKKAQYMIQNNQIPDDIKKLINNFQKSNSSNSSNINSNSYNNSNSSSNINSQSLKNANNYNNTYNNTRNSSNYNNFYNQTQPYNNYSKNNFSSSNNNFKNENRNNERTSSQNSSNSSIPDIDMETLMKIQSIMSKMKSSENDDMSRLLLSLKPYLRDGKKDKIDEYIKLIKMGKMTQFMNSFGGDKK